MANDKKRDDLTVFGKETDNREKTPQPLKNLDNIEEVGEQEMDAAIRDEEVKASQDKSAGM